MQDIIKIIQENSLTVRCLPYEVVSLVSYKEGDEEKGKQVIIEHLELDYFIKNNLNNTNPNKRFEQWKQKFPNGRKYVREVKQVEFGGYWYVKETKDTNSTISFNRQTDKFFAPTLQEAIQLYLNSKI